MLHEIGVFSFKCVLLFTVVLFCTLEKACAFCFLVLKTDGYKPARQILNGELLRLTVNKIQLRSKMFYLKCIYVAVVVHGRYYIGVHVLCSRADMPGQSHSLVFTHINDE